MHDLLIYLTEKVYRDEVRQLFSGAGWRATLVEDLDEVGELLQQELFDLILVWTGEFEKLSNVIALLEVDNYDYIPVVAATPHRETALKMAAQPVVDVLTIPMAKEEFFQRIRLVLEDSGAIATVVEGSNWQGSIEEYNLVDLIQMIEHRGVDAILTMTCNGKSGQVFFRKGKIVDAQFQTLQGMNALKKMAFWPYGYFKTALGHLPDGTDQLRLSNQDILMILIEYLVKQSRLLDGLPELDELLQLVPGQSIKELTPLQHLITNYCDQPTSTLDLLLSLGDQNEDILTEVHVLLQQGVLGRYQEIKDRLETRQQSGLGKLVSSLSSLFKRKEETPYYGADYYEDQEESFQPALEIAPLKLTGEIQEQIQQKISRMYP